MGGVIFFFLGWLGGRHGGDVRWALGELGALCERK
jgi:hypothetical protein